MRLENVQISNFRLLEDVSIRFSVDSQRPLTVIRAENGSGKTSILYALRWAMYGNGGIPDGMRLTSTAMPTGKPVSVQVSVVFVETDIFSREQSRYRLIRTCTETPHEGDRFSRAADNQRLLKLTESGEVDILSGMSGQISVTLPEHLADVFFTNGDDVQRFIAGGQSGQRERQEKVHESIRHLLGLESVERVEKLARYAQQYFKRELASSGGEELEALEDERERLEDEIETKNQTLAIEIDNQGRLEEQIQRDERMLDKIKGVGDLEQIQSRIHSLESDLDGLDHQETEIRKQMKGILQSEGVTRVLIDEHLQKGIAILDELADRKVLPGSSIEILVDRLSMGVCICGESLIAGASRHNHIKQLIEEQRQVAPRLQRLTELWHHARNSENQYRSERARGFGVNDRANDLSEQLIECIDLRKRKVADLRVEEDRRSQIDESRVQELTERINSNHSKLGRFNHNIGSIESVIQGLKDSLKSADEAYAEAEKTAKLNETAQVRSAVSSDLHTLTNSILTTLKTDYVHQVSDRMNDLFMEIVGAVRDSGSAIFTGAHVEDQNYDIIIDSVDGRTLDADTELNGASQRALTLAFIWSLMEVTQREAPRIIDTPLGMTSGAVKRRMVDLLTEPIEENGLPYQTILFMTRSEIRDVEDLISDRSGAITTLTCSKDYPVDLVNNWSKDKPVVVTCVCDHTQICIVCERRADAGKFIYREG